MTKVVMPKFGLTMVEAVILDWRKQPGDRVEQDEVLLEIETDKVTVEVKSPVSGVIRSIDAAVGDTVPVGQTIALIDPSPE